MHLRSTIRTSFGPRGLPARPMIRIALTAHELHALAPRVEHDAVEAEAAGRYDTAQMLQWRAAALREAAR